MILPLDLDSERYGAYGNAAAEGILNQLGRPDLDMLSVLVRETVQNSWDARLCDHEPVRFGIASFTLSDEQLQVLAASVFAREPDHFGLRKVLSKQERPNVLLIYDRGTTGLNGPTRADRPDVEKGERRFVRFFRNVGQSAEQLLRGGKYGFGKSILYRISRIHTICVHTRCRTEAGCESRFMAAALQSRPAATPEYDPYTGRHWWGRRDEGVVEPLRGEDADEMARQLGFPAFGPDEAGTSCMILLPSFGDVGPQQAMEHVVQSLLWYCWPKMISDERGVIPMMFELSCEGSAISIPDPLTVHPLAGFVKAMNHLKRHPVPNEADFLSQVVSISFQRPKQPLGRLALQFIPFLEKQMQETSEDNFKVPIKGTCHHVALMRNTELVVNYLEGAAAPLAQTEYAGVFLVDKAVDEIFGKAEPPTHDDWQPQFLEENQQKRIVRKALEEIKKAVTAFATPRPTAGRELELVPLGAFADQLGSLLLSERGPGAYIPRQEESAGQGHRKSQEEDTKPGTAVQELIYPGSSGSRKIIGESPLSYTGQQRRSRSAIVRLLDEGRLILIDATSALLTSFRVEHVPGSKGTQVAVEARVVLDNGDLEREPPARSVAPEVLVWINPDGAQRSGSEVLRIPATDIGTWKVAVSIPENTIIQVNLTAAEE